MKSAFFEVNDEIHTCDLVIEGLEFQPNNFLDRHNSGVPAKLSSSPGPLISNFATFEQDFECDSYEVYLRQDDRLTFFGASTQPIIGYFVDCRRGSKTEKTQIILKFSPSLHRRLTIPRGVAHRFDHLHNLTARSEPIWYSDDDNASGGVGSDFLSIPRKTSLELFPLFAVNQKKLSDRDHIQMSLLQQQTLGDPENSPQRSKSKGKKQETHLQGLLDSREKRFVFLQKLIQQKPPIEGVFFKICRYDLTGDFSYTLAPTTESCVADVHCFTPDLHFNTMFKVHQSVGLLFTQLVPTRSPIKIDLADQRKAGGKIERLELPNDPRLALHIPPGVAYRVISGEEIFLRVESEIYSSEEWTNIASYGNDLIWLTEAETCNQNTILVGGPKCSPESARYLAKIESLTTLSIVKDKHKT